MSLRDQFRIKADQLAARAEEQPRDTKDQPGVRATPRPDPRPGTRREDRHERTPLRADRPDELYEA
ncbi:hypothetical protein [Streptomyces sp. SCSIO ZS0520]|uniref:hypothetical protein n=1 Tax=Streptomyces sp. SCSIO ZS0520 TaxID=2892996 RepID=UPI0021DB3DC6|nr:hypothetical protein [Streptomyces sp. SCSIO ZS0520]